MRPKVINIRSAPKGWTNDPQYVYIGRPRTIEGKYFDGYFGNHHPIGVRCQTCSYGDFESGKTHNIVHQRGEAISPFAHDLRQHLADPYNTAHFPSGFLERVKALSGKTLVCFCAPAPCHGDVLAQLCEELNGGK